jgi:iron donor protein CyaY
MMEEKEYRLLVKDTYARIESALENVDPDLLEVEPGLGTLAFLTKKGKTILSTQPSVRQLWLAAASQGTAIHFNWDAVKKQWVDDRGEGKELYKFLADLFKTISGIQVTL